LGDRAARTIPQQGYRLSYLFISRDLRVVRALSHYILAACNGQVVEHGASDQIFENPQETYTHPLMRAAFDLEVA
jgi:ABC-type microcin C transport system duplicated ATPase subunit YejF